MQCTLLLMQRCVDQIRLSACRIQQLTSAAADRRYELGRQPANTKLSSHVAVRRVRVRGGNYKFRALRLDHGNFSWGTEVGSNSSSRQHNCNSLNRQQLQLLCSKHIISR